MISNKKYTYLIAILTGIYPALFFASLNINEMSITSIALTSVALSTIGIVIILILQILLKYLPTSINKYQHQLYLGLLFTLLIFYFRHPIQSITIIEHALFNIEFYVSLLTPQKSFTIITIITGLLLGTFLHRWPKQIAGTLAILVTFNLYQTIEKYTQLPAEEQVSYSKEKQIESKVQFKNKKNIFFILTDSFTSIEGLKLLNINEKPFLDKLKAKGFSHYPHFFTTAQKTKFALPSFFNLNIKYNDKHIYEVHPNTLSKIASGQGLAYEILKNNDYKTHLVADNTWILRNNCTATTCYPKSSKAPNGFTILIDKLLLGNKYQSAFEPHNKGFRPLTKSFIQQVNTNISQSNIDAPSFHYIHTIAPHHSGEKVRETCSEKEALNSYKKRIKKATLFLLNTIEKIQETDKDALIIITSDHGPYIYQKCSSQVVPLEKRHIIERQGALLSIHWGQNYDGKYDKDIKSSHNLFRYIFSYLAENEKLLTNADKDHAYSAKNERALSKNMEYIQTIDDGKFIIKK